MMKPFPRLISSILLVTVLMAAAAPRAGAMCCPIPCFDCWITSSGQLNLIVMDRENDRVQMIPNIRFLGDAASFALIVPTPALPSLSPAPGDIWDEASQMTAPIASSRRGSDSGFGCGSRADFASTPPRAGGGAEDDTGVIVHGRETVGAFVATIISSEDPAALVTWLSDNQFDLSADEARSIAPYAERGWFFTAMKLDTSRPEGQVPIGGWNNNVDPVVFDFAADELEVPLSIIGINRQGTLKTVFYVVDTSRAALDGFETLYSNKLTRSEVDAVAERYPNLASYTQPGLYLTRLERTFRSTETMEGSLMLKSDGSGEEVIRFSERLDDGAGDEPDRAAFPGEVLLLAAVPFIARRVRRHF